MIVLSDNDILYKLAYCDLLCEFVSFLQVPSKSIMILPTCIFKLRKVLKSEPVVLARIDSFCREVSVLTDDGVDMGILTEIADTGVDAGEALLAAQVATNPDAYLVTGDKRAIRAFAQLPVGRARSGLAGRILCFEELMIGMLQRFGFSKLEDRVTAGAACDGVLRIAFGQGRNEQHALACLNSFAGELRSTSSVFLVSRHAGNNSDHG
jgi:hypothetical protein